MGIKKVTNKDNCIYQKHIWSIILAFAIFFVCLLIQYSCVYMYHDDYGYAALNYGVSVDTNGMDYSFADIIKFVSKHYQHVNGRILGFIFEISLLKCGLSAIRIFNCCAILSIFIAIWLLSRRTTTYANYIIAIFMLCTFGLFQLDMYTGGFYWFSASMAYLVPIPAFFLFCWIYNFKLTNRSFLKFIICVILIITASFSHEVVSVGVFAYIFLLGFYKYTQTKQIDIKDFILLLVSLSGLIVIVFAPGNFIRINDANNAEFYQMDTFHKIKNSIPYIIRLIFNKNNLTFISYFVIMVSYCSYKNLMKSRYLFIILINILILFCSSLYAITSMILPFGCYDFIKNHINIYNLIMIVFVLMCMYSIILYLYNRQNFHSIIIISSGFISMCSLVAAPTDVHCRVSIFFYFCVYYIMTVVLSYVFKENIAGNKSLIITVLTLVLCVIPIANFAKTYNGYKLNSSINKYNDKKLKEASIKTKNGGDYGQQIILKKLVDDRYADDQPYKANYIYNWMKAYYDLSSNTEITYK